MSMERTVPPPKNIKSVFCYYVVMMDWIICFDNKSLQPNKLIKNNLL